MKKAISLLICLCMLLASCAPSVDETQSDTQTNSTESEQQDIISLSEFTLVYPVETLGAYTKMFTKFELELENKTGLDLPTTDDALTPDNRDAFEILLGDTNRKESSDALSKIKDNGYTVCMTGNKLVINAKTKSALEAALQKCLWLFSEGNTNVSRTLFVSENIQSDTYDKLTGLTINAIGDSYFAGAGLAQSDTWLGMLSKKYSMKLNNYGVNGSTVSNYSDNHPMCDRYTSMSADADIIIVEGGRNDFNVKAPIGELDSRDTKTFAGALNTIFDGLKEKYPDALILGVTCWYVNNDMKAYSDMMLALCKEQGIPCFNAADRELSGVDMTSASFRAKYCLNPNDISHLNAAGMKLVLPAFERFIGEAYTSREG